MASLFLSATTQRVLQGVPLPATRAQLIDYARRQGAPETVMDALGNIRDRSYRWLDELTDEIVYARPRVLPNGKGRLTP